MFIAGLMVGRTPEYLGKKIEQKEVKMAMLAMLVAGRQHPGLQPALSSVIEFRRKTATGTRRARRSANMNNNGPHGLSEILYAYISGTGNNGSAFGGHQREYALVQPDDRPRDADRPLPVADSAAGGRRAAWRRRSRSRSTAEPSRRMARCSSACWSGRVIIVGALTFFPGAFAGADCRALT